MKLSKVVTGLFALGGALALTVGAQAAPSPATVREARRAVRDDIVGGADRAQAVPSRAMLREVRAAVREFDARTAAIHVSGVEQYPSGGRCVRGSFEVRFTGRSKGTVALHPFAAYFPAGEKGPRPLVATGEADGWTADGYPHLSREALDNNCNGVG